MHPPYFRTTAAGYEPHEGSAGPWSPDMLHGRLLGGLAARALERQFASAGWRAARLTVDLFRPAPMAPVSVAVVPVRQGRRIVVADALLTCGGHEVGRATAVFLREGEPPVGRIWQPEHWQPEPPASYPRLVWDDGRPLSAWEFRIVEGGFGTGERARVWTRDGAGLVDDEPMSPFVRAAVSGDIASPLANGADIGVAYINGDYTLVLARYPVGEWIAVEATEHLAADGIALGACTLFDESGPFGTSTATALANPPLVNPPTTTEG